MSKTLILVRHGRAENRENGSPDFKRRLTKTGNAETEKMAQFLLREGFCTTAVICSEAVRASETAAIFARELRVEKKNFSSLKDLYYANANAILNHINRLDERIDCILIVGHNPGISELVRRLSAGRTYFMENSQTAVFQYDIKHWYQVGEKDPGTFNTYRVSDLSD